MQAFNVVVAQADCVAAEHLAAFLHKYFRNVAVARDLDEIRRRIVRTRADALVLDLELVSFAQVRELRADFGSVSVVCTHRVPDHQMWAAALEHGASDMCALSDRRSIVTAIYQECAPMSSRQAA